ncbi:calcitonin gene-related peptide type 1 receptor-like [Limulus polyphemus]|uniref:Calcitonin gene-related peptide type 1 receptor-like n=1 Tax=Limulus polyphemus TaxID=6850 RepID=A0ABM1TED6_LIMPO|nr:calcitonin gene-related peptide type 1 receptor-like [Limulus polyphemus]
MSDENFKEYWYLLLEASSGDSKSQVRCKINVIEERGVIVKVIEERGVIVKVIEERGVIVKVIEESGVIGTQISDDDYFGLSDPNTHYTYKVSRALVPPSKKIVIDNPHCPRTWDGWHCWSDTPGGKTARSVCPDHVYFKSDPPKCPRYAEKVCWPNGTWFVNNQNNEWTDYLKCGIVKDLQNRLYFQVATFAVSIFLLLPALVIFSVYKQLQVHRITMHKHLFMALLLNGVFVITFTSVVLMEEVGNNQSLLKQNGVICKILLILKSYFRMTTYMWMLCEGFYLHKLIASAFAEQKNLLMFYIIGWVFPVLPVSIYSVIRKTLADESCWAIPEETYEWILNTPNLLSLLLNLAFLCNIIRVLVTKLRAPHTNEPSQFRKTVRATLVLIPLFGLHFTLVIYRPAGGSCGWIEAYFYFSYAMDGLQGCLVALIFCYLNGEVRHLLKRSYRHFKLNRTLGETYNSNRKPRFSMSMQATSVTDGGKSMVLSMNSCAAIPLKNKPNL